MFAMTLKRTRCKLLEHAIRKFGMRELSLRLSKTRRLTVQAISQWERVPADRCIDFERITGLSRHDLRPDIFGPKPRKRAGSFHAAA